jgi:type IV fimbrial biogenesis protein FimT
VRHTAFRHAGVTLIELMIGLAVLAVLLAIAAPSFADFFEKARVKGAADDLTNFLALARNEATKRDRNVRVVAGGAVGAWCFGANASPEPVPTAPVGAAATCDCTVATQCMVAGTRTVFDSTNYLGVTLDAIDDDVTFDRKLGSLTTLVGTQMDFSSRPLRNGRYILRVNISPMGHARACVPPGALPMPGYRAC